MKKMRLRASDRVTGVLWALIVTGAAVTAMYALSGYAIDTELVLIGGLVTLGGWLFVSALLAMRPPRSTTPEPEPSGLPSDVKDDES